MNLHESKKNPNIEKLQELYREQGKIIERQKRIIIRLEKELQAILDSKVWRCAEFFRRIIRIHIFNWFPSLQITIIPALKRKIRTHLLHPLVKAGICKDEYSRWVKYEQECYQKTKETAPALIDSLEKQPLISLVMPVYNVRPDWLRKAVGSVLNQSYQNWQLCVADDCSTDPFLKDLLEQLSNEDPRIVVSFLGGNIGIAGASNAAFKLAEGEFIGLLDNDDELAPNALLEVVKVINQFSEVDFIYSDEDKISENGNRYDGFFKPDWSPDTLRSYNYVCHFSVIRKTLMETVGGFREGFDGSQDYDLFLRVGEKARYVHHIPQILYHWRAIEGSVGKRGDAKMYAYDSARKALQEHLDRVGIEGSVEAGQFLGSYRIRHSLKSPSEIAILIPTKDKVDVLKRCISSILIRSTYLNYKVIIIDNGSIEKETFAYYDTLKSNDRIQILTYDKPFNFSAINNFAVSQTDAEYILFLNNDTEVITPNWLEEMAGYLQQKNVGAVGSLLYYSNDTVQHGGIIMGIGGIAGHSHKYFSRNDYGYFGRLKVSQNLSAVTAACLMTTKTVFNKVGGFEEKLSHAFNDVDLCLKIREQGYRIVYTPFAEMYHHESVSRGYENTPEKKQRFNREREFCEECWGHVLSKVDPYYNKNLSLSREDFSICSNILLKELESRR